MKSSSAFLWLVVLAAALSIRAQQPYRVSVDGNTVNVTVGLGLIGGQCCRGASLDNSEVPTLCSQPCGQPITQTFTCNWVGVHTVYIKWSDDTTNGYRTATEQIGVSTPAADNCGAETGIAFEIQDYADGSPDPGGRVLLSNMHYGPNGAPDYAYPGFQQLLARDRVTWVALRTFLEGVAQSAVPVILRVIDPPDPSPYVAGGSSVVLPVPGAQADDNRGTELPKLVGPSVIDNGNGTYSVVSGENGYIGVELHLGTDAVAGDNYRVVASATFPDGTTRTATSGTITVWKRVFLEKRQMFRRGAPLVSDAPAGLRTIVLPFSPIATSGTTEFVKNDHVMLLHAPKWGEAKSEAAYYRGSYRIITKPTKFKAAALQTGRGTVTTNGTTLVVGEGTQFGRLTVGAVLNIGPDSRTIVAIADATHATIHQPASTAEVGQAYTIGDPNLEVGKYYLRLNLDRPLTEAYFREPLAPNTVLRLNDAVVRLSAPAPSPADYLDLDESMLTGAPAPPWLKPLAAAFVEYVAVSPQTWDEIRPIPRFVLFQEPLTQQFVDKWFRLATPTAVADASGVDAFKYSTPPNHQLLLIAESNNQDLAKADSNGVMYNKVQGEKVSIVYRATVEKRAIEFKSATNEGDPEVLTLRTAAHELVHQWETNQAAFGTARFDHCHPTVAFSSTGPYPTRAALQPAGFNFCLMSNPGEALDMVAPWDTSSAPITVNMVMYYYRNGALESHMIPVAGGWHSEYTAIRERPDPFVP